jgi:galactokinase/mevalonate kinase-like predicted kinase
MLSPLSKRSSDSRCSRLCGAQGVLRRWFARLPEVVDTVSNLVSNAEAIQPAVLGGDVTAFGQCVSNYWSQKKLMAGDGVEPTLITRALAAMAPRLAGYTLAGAGGGGFVLLVTKEPRDREGLQAALDTIVHTFTLHGAQNCRLSPLLVHAAASYRDPYIL